MALLDRCPHRGAALSEGRMTALGSLQCAYHVRAPVKLISHYASLLIDERMTRGAALQCAYHVRPADVILWCDACFQVTMFESNNGDSLDIPMRAGVQGWTFDGESGECVNIPQVRCKAAHCMFIITSPEGQLWQAFPVCELEAWGSRDCACAVQIERSQGAMPRYGHATLCLHICR